MRTLYFDCASGISGDMTVGALLDLGADREALLRGLGSLGVDGYEVEIGRVNKNGIEACAFDVVLNEEKKRRLEHPQDYERERPEKHNHRHHDHEHEHHEHEDDHEHEHGHSHEHRGIGDIRRIILGSGLTPRAKQYALRIFEVLANAEGKIHGILPEDVCFHEVGAVDSIVDIASAAILVDSLNVDRIVCSTLSEGQGKVKCQHGWIPVPAPATLEIVKTYQIPLRLTGLEGELVTPTGAAIVAALAESFALSGEFTVLGVGYGAGKRDYPNTANVLRALLVGEAGNIQAAGQVCEISCNLDDISGEDLAFACEELMRAGALDVWVAPVTMKKGRCGHLLGLLCEPEREAEFSRLILSYTSTIGVRSVLKRRMIMDRKLTAVNTRYGPVAVKESSLDGIFKVKVEFESAKAIALEKNLPVNLVLNAAYSELSRAYSNRGAAPDPAQA